MTPRSEYGLSLEYLSLNQKAKHKVSDALRKSEIRAGLINMLQKNVYI